MAMEPDLNPMRERCAHCGHVALGYATVTGPHGSVRVCHDEKRDCYHLITVWGATLGEQWHAVGGVV